jgi:hypothetical protein
MQLEDKLNICLLALESRYPDHVVDINQDILAIADNNIAGWSAGELIAYLEQNTILESMARLVIDCQCSEIYLIEQSESVPAIFIHCRGKIPEHEQHAQAAQV